MASGMHPSSAAPTHHRQARPRQGPLRVESPRRAQPPAAPNPHGPRVQVGHAPCNVQQQRQRPRKVQRLEARRRRRALRVLPARHNAVGLDRVGARAAGARGRGAVGGGGGEEVQQARPHRVCEAALLTVWGRGGRRGRVSAAAKRPSSGQGEGSTVQMAARREVRAPYTESVRWRRRTSLHHSSTSQVCASPVAAAPPPGRGRRPLAGPVPALAAPLPVQPAAS
jgi:hypothetical protein